MALRNVTEFYVNEKNIEQMYVGVRPSKYSSIKEKRLISIRESSGNSTTVGTTPAGISQFQFLVSQQGYWWDLPSAVLTYRIRNSVAAYSTSANSLTLETVYSFLQSLLITSGQTIEQIPQNLSQVICHEINRSVPRSTLNDSLCYMHDWRTVEDYCPAVSGVENLGRPSVRQCFANFFNSMASTGLAPFNTTGITAVIPMYLISNFFKVNKLWCGDLDFAIQLQLQQTAGSACFSTGDGSNASLVVIDNVYVKMNALKLDEVVHNTLISLMEATGKPVVYPFDAVMVYPQNATLATAATNLDISWQISNNYVKQLSLIARQNSKVADVAALKNAFECIVPLAPTTLIQFRALVNGTQYPERPIDYVGELWELTRECYGLNKNIDVASSTSRREYESTSITLPATAANTTTYQVLPAKFSIDLPLAQMQNAEFGAIMGKLLSSSAAPVTLTANWLAAAAASYQCLLLCYHLRLVKVEGRAVSVTQV